MHAFDERFDSFWDRLRTGHARLRAVRTRAVLSWRFRNEIKDNRLVIVTVERSHELAGYAVLVHRTGSEREMNLYDIADLQSLDESPDVSRNLLLGSIRIAREEGIDAVKFLPGTPAKRQLAELMRPYTYTLPFWQQYYRASPPLATALSAPDIWDPSLFDTQ
jgi:hypothetical protein